MESGLHSRLRHLNSTFFPKFEVAPVSCPVPMKDDFVSFFSIQFDFGYFFINSFRAIVDVENCRSFWFRFAPDATHLRSRARRLC